MSATTLANITAIVAVVAFGVMVVLATIYMLKKKGRD